MVLTVFVIRDTDDYSGIYDVEYDNGEKKSQIKNEDNADDIEITDVDINDDYTDDTLIHKIMIWYLPKEMLNGLHRPT